MGWVGKVFWIYNAKGRAYAPPVTSPMRMQGKIQLATSRPFQAKYVGLLLGTSSREVAR